MAREKRKSLTKGEYRRHIFDRARGEHGVKGARSIYDDDAWIKRSFAEQYEQDNSKKGWWSLDSTDRANFRARELEKSRKAFRDSLSQHHWAKYRDNVNRFSQLADAYMNQTDAQFEATMAQMGISKSGDRARWRKAMEESLSNAVDGKAMSQNWDDQEDLAYSRGDSVQQVASVGERRDGEPGGAAGGAPRSGTVISGRAKAPSANAAPATPALTPRNAGPPPRIIAGSMKRHGRVAGQAMNQINEANVRTGNHSAMIHMDQAAASMARDAALRSADRAQIQTVLSSLTPSEAYELRQNERDRIDQIGKDRHARQAAEREAAAQRRADKRFADRTLYNEADWKNLGREGSNKADYSDRREGESDQDWAVRNKARQERQGRMDALLKRLDAMGEQDADKNPFYANDPNKQQNLARLRGLIVGDDGKVRGDITDAQIEGANATLDAWKKGADEKGARQKAFADMKQAEEVSRLRNMYGMQLSDGFKAKDVLEFHQAQQAKARKKILEGMQKEGGDHLEDSHNLMVKFSRGWQKLIDNGFNPTTTFQEAMTKDDMRDAYNARMKELDVNDPDYRDKTDQLRRHFTVQYAMQQAGVGGERETNDTERTLPSSPREEVGGEFSLLPRRAQKAPGVQIVYSMADAVKARDAANAAAGIPLKRKTSSGGRLL